MSGGENDMVNWDLQQYLSDMKDELREDNKVLADKLDYFSMAIHKLDKRISVVENTRRLLFAVAGALGVAVLGFVADMAVNHFGK